MSTPCSKRSLANSFRFHPTKRTPTDLSRDLPNGARSCLLSRAPLETLGHEMACLPSGPRTTPNKGSFAMSFANSSAFVARTARSRLSCCGSASDAAWRSPMESKVSTGFKLRVSVRDHSLSLAQSTSFLCAKLSYVCLSMPPTARSNCSTCFMSIATCLFAVNTCDCLSGLIASELRSISSRLPYSFISLSTPLMPKPRRPGRLSDLSPMSARMST
mmetsp:Transcript_9580/g.28948  ORF Transcript_9580/g.28948 Transcript_9580/m.28948 type:complete len:217 (+) Transcript_9580:1830-2480(+)